MTLTRHRFEQLVARAVRRIPARFRDAMRNVAVVVEDAPADYLLAEMGITPPDTLYGLAVDPRRSDAARRLFAVKRRPAGLAVPLIAADASWSDP